MRVRALIPLLFASGAAALVLEVSWFRRIAQLAGATSVALGAVLAAVIGGMAAGAWLLGRYADRTPRPLRLYATLEAGVVLSALVSPWLLDGSAGVHIALQRALGDHPTLLAAARFVFCTILLAPPALFLGGTLPAAAAALRAPPDRLGRDLGWLYAANTFGAVAGTLAAGFLLLPAFGLAGTMRCAALLAVAAAAGGFSLARREAPASPSPAPPPPSTPGARRAIALYAASGFLGLAAEVAFTRSLVLVFGSATYAFTTMLAVFLLGIAGGAALGTRLSRARARERLEATVGITAILFSVAALAVYALPRLYLQGHLAFGPGFSGGLALRFLLSSAVLLPGAIGLGVAFPLAARLAAEGGAGAGTGRLYAANTFASVAGSTAAVFLLVPALGPQRAVVTAAVAAALVAFLVARRPLLLAAAGVSALGFLPPPAAVREHLYAGVYHSPENYLRNGRIDAVAWQDGVDLQRVLFGREATVTLHRWYGPVSLLVDGKAEASRQSMGDVQHLALLGHLPMTIHPAPQRALVVGLGLGVTYEAVAAHRPTTIVVVEIEAAVAEAAASLGTRPPRVVIADARTYLKATREEYDVITSDPIHPWVRGSGDLYTREYFLSVRDRLAPGGVACQWLPLYQMGLRDVKEVIRTFASVFFTAAYFGGSDLILVGGAGAEPGLPRAVDAALLLGAGETNLARMKVAGDEALRAAVGEGPLLGDDALRLEYATPRQVGNPELGDCLHWVGTVWGVPPPPYDALLEAQEAWARGDGTEWSALVARALAQQPDHAALRRYVGESDLQIVTSMGGAGLFDRAHRYLERARGFLPGDPRILGVEADLRAAAGDLAAAAALYERLLADQPDNAYVQRRLRRVTPR